MSSIKVVSSNDRQRTMTKGAIRNIADGSNASSLGKYFYSVVMETECPCWGNPDVLNRYLSNIPVGHTIITYNDDSMFLYSSDMLFIQRKSEKSYYVAGYEKGGERKFTRDIDCTAPLTFAALYDLCPTKIQDDKALHYNDDIIVLLYDEKGDRLVFDFDDCFNELKGEVKSLTAKTEIEPKQTIETKQENKIMSTKISNVIDKNKSALITAGKIEAGNIVIKRISKLITPKLPMLVRGYADTPAGRLVLANIFNFAVTQYAGQNKNAVMLADAALQGAMVEMMQSFNFNDLIDQVIDGVDLSRLTSDEE